MTKLLVYCDQAVCLLVHKCESSSTYQENRHTVNHPEAALRCQKDLVPKEFPGEPKWVGEGELNLPRGKKVFQHDTPWFLVMLSCAVGARNSHNSASCLPNAGEPECNRTGQVACGEKCIPVTWLCNGEQDCPDGTDEQCGKHFSRCYHAPALVSKSRVGHS